MKMNAKMITIDWLKINVEFMSLNIDNDGSDVNLAANIDFADDDIGCDGGQW